MKVRLHAGAATLPTGARSGAARTSRSIPRMRRASPRARRRSSAFSRAASPSMGSTPASASSRACASPTRISRRLQRNIVLSHAAGRRRADAGRRRAADDGAETRLARPRRLGRTAARRSRSSRRCWSAASSPVVPAQGSVGASGDLAPLAHMAGGDDRRRRGAASAASACRPPRRSRAAGLAPVELGPKEGLALLNGTQFSTAHALAGLFEAERAISLGAGRPARCRPTPRAAPTRRSIRAFTPCAAIAARSRSPAALRALMAGSAIRASHLTGDDARAGPLLPALPAAGDGRLSRSAAPGGARRSPTRPTASPTIR